MEQNLNPKITEQDVAQSEEKGSVGAFIASLIIVIIIVLGGMYFWDTITSESINKDSSDDETSEVSPENDSINLIEEDLQDTDLEDLDAELESIEAEFDAELSA